MELYTVVSDRLALAAFGGKTARISEKSARAATRVPLPKLPSGEEDTRPYPAAVKMRAQVRKALDAARLADAIDADMYLQVKNLLKQATPRLIVDVLDATGAFTFPIPNYGAVVLENKHGSAGGVRTAENRTVARVRKAGALIERGAIEQARTVAGEIEAA